MSNFNCETCGKPIIDSPRGYTTGCEHYPLEPPAGCQEIPGFILVVEPEKSWLTADGNVTQNWHERGVWANQEDCAKFLDLLEP